MKEDKTCPCCGEKLSFFYLKPNCPACGADILRYNAEARLQQDAVKAQKEVDALWRFFRRVDKARLIEKYCRKKNKPLPWETAAGEAESNE